MARPRRLLAVLGFSMFAIGAAPARSAETRMFNVRDYGAVGDGRTLDTAAINKAVEACAAAGGGGVVLPPGRYLSGTVRLKSNVTLDVNTGATLVGSTDLADYEFFTPPAFMPESRFPKWHRALILAVDAEHIAITGGGVIDGNKVPDPQGEEHMRGPHTILLGNCRHASISNVTVQDAGNYAILFELSDQVEIRHVKITGGWDGVHFRGWRDRPCRDVTIAGCQMFTGDDCIAGRYWANTQITDCVLNSSCNCVRLIGPATHLAIEKCRMYGPGVYPHRTRPRYNTLTGLNLQPGAWDGTQGALDDVTISDITMQNVSSVFHFVLKPGNTAGRITVSHVQATGVYLAAASVESWAETPFQDVTFRDVSIEYTGGGSAAQSKLPIKPPGNDARPLPVWGFYLRHVHNVTFDHVRLSCAKPDARPALLTDGVDRLTLDAAIEQPTTGEATAPRTRP